MLSIIPRPLACFALFFAGISASIPLLAEDPQFDGTWKISIRPRVRVAQGDGALPVPVPPAEVNASPRAGLSGLTSTPPATNSLPGPQGQSDQIKPAHASESPKPTALPAVYSESAPTTGVRTENGILIIPGPSKACGATVNGRTYQEAYNSVPYSLTEYFANPGYRHEAAMEILFEQMRPTTVQKNYTPERVPDPEMSLYRPYLFAHPENWIYQFDYRNLWYLRPQLFSPYGL